MALAQLREEEEALKGQGVNVVAISPDSPRDSARLAAELDLRFPLLSDAGRGVAARFGLFLPNDVLPGAFLVDGRGRILWSSVGEGPTDQPSPPSPRVARDLISAPAPLGVPAPSSVLSPVVAVGVAVVLLLLGVLARVANHDLLTWDVPVREAVLGLDAAWFAVVMRRAGELGSRWLIVALTIPMAALAWARCRQLAVVLIAAFPAALALELFLKAIVDRPRPLMAAGFGSSFPSGHVLAAAAFWGLVPPWIYLVTRRRWAWAASAGLAGLALVLVGVSRIYVGAHWPSDVVGGYLGGAVFLLAAEWAVRRPSPALACEACDLHPLRGGGRSQPLPLSGGGEPRRWSG
ncbi:MAG TPA: phosphatase PAP2 family protein [Acidimicrobiales bacterium]|nr:phosphatase PAP2 family protein [Acidimicrobiales bacterium]